MRLFWRNEVGALLYVFVIMFPLILVLFGLALDGANSMRTRARLNDAVKHGLYVVTVENGDASNNKMLKKYIKSYLGSADIVKADISIFYNELPAGAKPKLAKYVDPTKLVSSGGSSNNPLVKKSYKVNAVVKPGKLMPFSFNEKNVLVGSDSHGMTTYDYVKGKVLYARPAIGPRMVNGVDMAKRYTSDSFGGWVYPHGFKVQSENPNNYHLNFPTTGANNLYFQLVLDGVDASKLSWPELKVGQLSVKVIGDANGNVYVANNPSAVEAEIPSKEKNRKTTVTVVLQGPSGVFTYGWGKKQLPTNSVSRLTTLPAKFVVEGKYEGKTVVSYGFVIKKWFFAARPRVPEDDSPVCNKIGTGGGFGYNLAAVSDLTNAVGDVPLATYEKYEKEWYHKGWNYSYLYPDQFVPYPSESKVPLSCSDKSQPCYKPKHATRVISGQFFSEWGPGSDYPSAYVYTGYYSDYGKLLGITNTEKIDYPVWQTIPTRTHAKNNKYTQYLVSNRIDELGGIYSVNTNPFWGPPVMGDFFGRDMFYCVAGGN